jgi:hypothetical protein
MFSSSYDLAIHRVLHFKYNSSTFCQNIKCTNLHAVTKRFRMCICGKGSCIHTSTLLEILFLDTINCAHDNF